MHTNSMVWINSFAVSIWAKTEHAITLYGESAYGTMYDNNYLLYPAQVHAGLNLPSAESGAGVGLAVGSNGVAVYEHTGWHLPVMLQYASEIGTGWNHYVVTISDNGSPVLYVNGQYVRTGVDTGYPKIFAFLRDDKDVESGVGGGCYGHFRGGLDDLRIYNRALSAAEVKALYDGTAVTPEPVSYTVTWYVNGLTGADSNSGTSESVPKATIQAAIDAADDGDTILVAPGMYAPITSTSKTLTIRSTHGKGVTVIDGRGTSRCVCLSNVRGSFGPPEASSGAFDSTIEGFTVRNGYCESEGGGVFGGTVKDCIIECSVANGSHNGGGAYGSRLYHCIVRHNIAEDDGGGLHSCIAYDTLIVGNEAHNSIGGEAGAGASCSRLYNCTITKNTSTGSGAAALDYYISAYNCIVWGNVEAGGGRADVGYSSDSSMYNCYISDPGFVDATNGDYRLAEGSPCIDVGDNSYVVTAVDLDGNVRIVNGTVDIGCYEYNSTAALPSVEMYTMTFDSNGGTGIMDDQTIAIGKVARLNPCTFVAPKGKRFAGWRRTDNGRRYDDGVMVFDLAGEPGAVVVLEAVWEDSLR